jgi:hypothetical protein
MKIENGFDPHDHNVVKQIIAECDKWDGYTGTNVDGEEVQVFIQQGQGMIIKTKHTAKPKWWECVEFDVDGYQAGVTYEPTAELEEIHERIKARRVS